MNYIWSVLKNLMSRIIASQEALGRARAAQHLAAMGYHKEAKSIMLDK